MSILYLSSRSRPGGPCKVIKNRLGPGWPTRTPKRPRHRFGLGGIPHLLSVRPPAASPTSTASPALSESHTSRSLPSHRSVSGSSVPQPRNNPDPHTASRPLGVPGSAASRAFRCPRRLRVPGPRSVPVLPQRPQSHDVPVLPHRPGSCNVRRPGSTPDLPQHPTSW